jgi:hypothetical protein
LEKVACGGALIYLKNADSSFITPAKGVTFAGCLVAAQAAQVDRLC